MSDQDKRAEIEETEGDRTDRRGFLERAALAGGGALAAMAGLTAMAEAAETGPILRTGPTIRTVPMEGVQLLLPASVQQHTQFMSQLKEIGAAGPRTSTQWRQPLAEAKLAPADRVAAVVVTELSQRFAGLPDVGKNIATLFTLLARGAEGIQGIDPRAAGQGCGGGCGYGCMAGVASGFICGNNCSLPQELLSRTSEMGARAGGFICGNNCSQAGLRDLTIDMEGTALADVNFATLNMGQVAASMRNAAEAYNQVFAR